MKLFFFFCVFAVLLKLARNVVLDKVIKKICLPIAPNQFSYFTDDSWKDNIISDRQLKIKRNVRFLFAINFF